MNMPTEVIDPAVFIRGLSAATSTLPPQQLARAWGLIAIVGLTGLIFVLILVVLIVLRRMRRRAGRQRESQREPQPLPDAWQESARRLKVEPEEEEQA